MDNKKMNHENRSDVKPLISELVSELTPTGISVVRRELKTIRKRLSELEPLCDNTFDVMLQEIHKDDTLSPEAKKFLWAPVAEHYIYDRIRPLQDHARYLEKILKMWQFRNTPAGEIDDAMIARAKSVPIARIATVNRAGFMICPYHSEKTPSCHVFKESQFKCFGCGKSGDVIDLFMKMNAAEFPVAIMSLAGRA